MNKPIKKHPIKNVGKSDETINGKNKTLKTIKATHIHTIFIIYLFRKRQF